LSGPDAIGWHLAELFSNARAQLATTTSRTGSPLSFKCPFQANVMKCWRRRATKRRSSLFDQPFEIVQVLIDAA
jgi:hypothetical protein